MRLWGCHMSNRVPHRVVKQAVHILGDGCAGMSLAAKADELPRHRLTMVIPNGAPEQRDHIWGFWKLAGLEKAVSLARHKWHRLRVITPSGSTLLRCDQHPYHALHRKQWQSDCRKRAKAHGVSFIKQDKLRDDPNAQVLDSRPPPIPDGQMVQHFIGWEIAAPKGSFDPETAILMDFRCDQSRGIHFMYVLPFSDRRALVESTMFAPQREPDTFFEAAMMTYIEQYHHINNYEIERFERGAIPLGRLPRGAGPHIGIGGNGEAIRPSSGYAFAFIQKQIAAAINNASAIGRTTERAGPLVIRRPHKDVDLWMDEVFVMALRHWPTTAPMLFLRMARALSGDEFALFLSGEAGWLLRLKVIIAMPKWIFLKALFRIFLGLKSDTGRLDNVA